MNMKQRILLTFAMLMTVCTFCVAQGREALKSAFAEKFIEHPDFKLDIKMMVADGDMVWVYLKNVDPEGNTKCRVVDMYRLVDGKLAEHWDVLQPC